MKEKWMRRGLYLFMLVGFYVTLENTGGRLSDWWLIIIIPWLFLAGSAFWEFCFPREA